jgi:hypothetical protein
MTDSIPDIDSFILRFVHPAGSDSAPVFRGSITHIQSSEEMAFKDWQEIEVFIRRFLTLDEGTLPPSNGPSST